MAPTPPEWAQLVSAAGIRNISRNISRPLFDMAIAAQIAPGIGKRWQSRRAFSSRRRQTQSNMALSKKTERVAKAVN